MSHKYLSISLSNEQMDSLLDCIQDSITRALEQRLVAHTTNDNEGAEWFEAHAEYLRELKRLVASGVLHIPHSNR